MKSTLSRYAAVIVAALTVLLMFGTADAQNKCVAKKHGCVAKKAACKLKCHEKAEKKGLALDPICIQKCEDKFDGGVDPAKGCFAKLEAKNDGPCLTTSDTAPLEAKVDAFVVDVIQEVDPFYPAVVMNSCSAGKKKCVSKKMKALLKCHEKAVKKGLALDTNCITKAKNKFDGGADPAKGCFEKLESAGGCSTLDDTAALEAKVDAFVDDVVCELQSPTCPCVPPAGICPTSVQIDVDGVATNLDLGWTGIVHDQSEPTMQRLTLGLGACANASHPCGSCPITGAATNAGGIPFNNHRCVGDTSIQCNSDPDCGINGPCHFFLGPPLPLSAGGVSICLTNDINGPVTGTADPDAATAQIGVPLNWRYYNGFTVDMGCPRCVGGFCNAGPRNGFACTTNGVSPLFGSVSFDCPPNPGSLIAVTSVPLDLRTGTQSRVLSAASPNCRAAGFTSLKCQCDTCNNAAATPCDDNADCVAVGATICGGRRCFGGANNGTPCSVNSECPGGLCGVAGASTAPNQCNDAVCSPKVDAGSCDEGECAAGPFDTYCALETYRGCINNSDCPASGDTCTGGQFRECFTDNGVLGGDVLSCGSPGAVCGQEAPDTVLSSLTCMPPTTSSAVNAAEGLPSIGRFTLPSTLTFN